MKSSLNSFSRIRTKTTFTAYYRTPPLKLNVPTDLKDG